MRFDLYAEAFMNFITNGTLIKRNKMSSVEIKTVYDRIITKQYETKVFFLALMPTEYKNNLTDGLRQILFEEFPKVDVKIIQNCEEQRVAYNDPTFDRRLKDASETYYSFADVFNSLSKEDRMFGKQFRDPDTGRKIVIKPEQLEHLKNVKESYDYVKLSAMQGQEFAATHYYVMISSKDIKELRSFAKRLQSLAREDGVFIKEMNSRNLVSFLDNINPATYKHDKALAATNLLMSEENLTALLPTRTKGLVNATGTLIGNDWETKLPFMLDWFESPSAQVNLICAKSGEGKTLLSNNICIQLAGQGVHSSALDFKGDEWIKLKNLVDTLVVDMTGPDAKFVNTLNISDMIGRNLDSEDTFNSAIESTVSLLLLMVNLASNEGNETDAKFLLTQAVQKTYNEFQVFSNSEESFSRSCNITYMDVVRKLPTLESASSITKAQRELCSLMYTRCSMYVSSNGQFANAFRNEVTVGEILDTPLVIYSFNKNSMDNFTLLDSLRVHMLMTLDGKKQTIRKKQKLHTAAFYEELTRCANAPMLIRYFTSVVTGSRSSNVTVFLLLNAIDTMSKDSFAGIKSNITTKIIGRVNVDDIKTLVDEFDCGKIKDKMTMIAENRRNLWRNCFAIDYDTGRTSGVAVVKLNLPPDILAMLNTREVVRFSK